MERRVVRDFGRLSGPDGQDFGDVSFEIVIDDRGHAAGTIRGSFGTLHAAMSVGRCSLRLPSGTEAVVIIVEARGDGSADFRVVEPVPFERC